MFERHPSYFRTSPHDKLSFDSALKDNERFLEIPPNNLAQPEPPDSHNDPFSGRFLTYEDEIGAIAGLSPSQINYLKSLAVRRNDFSPVGHTAKSNVFHNNISPVSPNPKNRVSDFQNKSQNQNLNQKSQTQPTNNIPNNPNLNDSKDVNPNINPQTNSLVNAKPVYQPTNAQINTNTIVNENEITQENSEENKIAPVTNCDNRMPLKLFLQRPNFEAIYVAHHQLKGPNPDFPELTYVIVTIDPYLIKYTPFAILKENKMVGAIVARNTFAIEDGKPVFYLSRDKIPFQIGESIDPNSFCGNKIDCLPFRFDDTEQNTDWKFLFREFVNNFARKGYDLPEPFIQFVNHEKFVYSTKNIENSFNQYCQCIYNVNNNQVYNQTTYNFWGSQGPSQEGLSSKTKVMIIESFKDLIFKSYGSCPNVDTESLCLKFDDQTNITEEMTFALNESNLAIRRIFDGPLSNADINQISMNEFLRSNKRLCDMIQNALGKVLETISLPNTVDEIPSRDIKLLEDTRIATQHILHADVETIQDTKTAIQNIQNAVVVTKKENIICNVPDITLEVVENDKNIEVSKPVINVIQNEFDCPVKMNIPKLDVEQVPVKKSLKITTPDIKVKPKKETMNLDINIPDINLIENNIRKDLLVNKPVFNIKQIDDFKNVDFIIPKLNLKEVIEPKELEVIKPELRIKEFSKMLDIYLPKLKLNVINQEEPLEVVNPLLKIIKKPELIKFDIPDINLDISKFVHKLEIKKPELEVIEKPVAHNIFLPKVDLNVTQKEHTLEIEQPKLNVIEKPVAQNLYIPKVNLNVAQEECEVKCPIPKILPRLEDMPFEIPVPKIVFNPIFNKEDTIIPIDLSSQLRDFFRQLTKGMVEVSLEALREALPQHTSTQFPSSAPLDDDPPGSSQQSSQLTLNSVGSSNETDDSDENSDNTNRDINTDDNNNNSDNPGHSDDGEETVNEDNLEDWLIRKLAAIQNKEQLTELVTRFRNLNVDMNRYRNSDPLKTPVIIQMKLNDRWLAIGQFHCYYCERCFNTAVALSTHIKSTHTSVKAISHQASTEYIIGKELRWSVDWQDRPDDMPKFRDVFVCPLKCCKYISGQLKTMSSHIKQHQDLETLKFEVGLFWGMLIMHARNTKSLLIADDLFYDRKAVMCQECKYFISHTDNGLQQHVVKSHKGILEGQIGVSINIEAKINWYSPENDRQLIDHANEEYVRFSNMMNKSITRNNNEHRQPNIPTEPNNNDANNTARNRRRRREDNLLEAHAQGRIRPNEARPQPRLHQPAIPNTQNSLNSPSASNSSNSSSSNSDVPSDMISENDDNNDALHRTLNNHIQKADNWKNKCMNQIKEFVNLPKLWGEKLANCKGKLITIFESKVNDILKWFDDALSIAKRILKNDDLKTTQLILCDGMIAKITLLLSKEIRNITHTTNRKKSNSKYVPKVYKSELPIKMRNATKFIAGVIRIHEIYEDNDTINDQSWRNVIRTIEQKLVRFLENSHDDFIALIGRPNVESIRALIADDNFEERCNFLRAELEEMEAKLNSKDSAKYRKFIQKVYAEDASRALNWFVLGDDTPECLVPIERFEETYGNTWENAADLGDDFESLFKLDKSLPEDYWDSFSEILFKDEDIQRTIASRSNLCANGSDGICNGVWKAGNKSTVSIIKKIMECMMDTGRFPETLKLNKTVMLYKKGDPKETKSWRPITITPTLYRMLMCHISRSLQKLNDIHKFVSDSQKGFMKIPSAAAEHAFIVDEMIHDASRGKKSLYIMTIDFQDAFGSVPHKLIKKNLHDIGFENKFFKGILDSYNFSSTRITSNNQKSRTFYINKGVKQGCPLSPVLFNICLEPLLKRLNSAKQYGYHWFGKSTVVQAYADDVILFSDTEKGMENLIKIVEDYCAYAGNMKINPKKCVSFPYIIDANRHRTILDKQFKIGDGFVTNVWCQSRTTYLGLPIAAKASERKKHVSLRIEEMSRDIKKISNSSLKFVQMVDAIKRFIIPRIDYELFSSAAPTIQLELLDRKIRGVLNKATKAAGIPIDWFYTSQNDGGLNLQMLSERQKALTIRLYVGLSESNDSFVRDVLSASDDAELDYRTVLVNEDSEFLKIPVNEDGSMVGGVNYGTSNLLARCVKSLYDLKLGLRLNDNKFILKDLSPIPSQDDDPINQDANTDSDSDNEDNNRNKNEFKVDTNNVMKIIMKIIKNRHYAHLCEHKMKGHSFITLKNSRFSSFFLKATSKMADSVVKFAVKARCNSLVTGAIKARRSLNPEDANCNLCGRKETLHHIINGCQKKKHTFTRRHNEVTNVIRKYVSDTKHAIVHEDKAVRSRDNAPLRGEYATLRPDLYWWDNDTLNIVETTIPYGMMTKSNGEMESTLSRSRKAKIAKYADLVDDCKNQFNCEVNFFTIIVSSLGAIPKETLDDLSKITKSKKDLKILACRMVAAALRESMFIFTNYTPRNRDRNDDDNENEMDSDGIRDDSDIMEQNETNTMNDDIDQLLDNIARDDDADDPVDRDELLNEMHLSENEGDDSPSSDELSEDIGDTLSDIDTDSEDTENTNDSEIDVLENPGTTPHWSNGHTPSSDTADDSVQQSSQSDDM